MRLNEQEVTAIKNAVAKYDPNAKIYLFGSRVYDNLRGGDIDIFVESKIIGLAEKIKIKIYLYDQIGEQKIDIVLPSPKNKHFIKMLKEEGILL